MIQPNNCNRKQGGALPPSPGSAYGIDQIHASWDADPATTFTIVCHTAEKPQQIQLEYVAAGIDDRAAVAAMHSLPSPGRGWLHYVRAEGLHPATEYEYFLRADFGSCDVRTGPWRISTAPAAPGDFTFCFISDTGLIGRPDGNANGTRQCIEEIKLLKPAVVLGGGDYAYANADGRFASIAGAVDEWFVQWQPLIASVPFMPQYGNHEIHLQERFEDWAPRFALPQGNDNGRDYSFDIGTVHFCALFMPDGENSPPTPQRLQWLDTDLANARKHGAQWLIVYQHEPLFAVGHSHPAVWGLHRVLTPIFERQNVDLVLGGHDQSFERTYPLRNAAGDTPRAMSQHPDTYRKGEGVVYAKISPSGKMSERKNDFSRFTKPKQPFMAVRDDTMHHYGAGTVSNSGRRLEVITYGIAGDGGVPVVVDRFVICE